VTVLLSLVVEILTCKQGCGSRSWTRFNFCGSGSTLKKEAGSGSKLGSD